MVTATSLVEISYSKEAAAPRLTAIIEKAAAIMFKRLLQTASVKIAEVSHVNPETPPAKKAAETAATCV